MKYDICWQLDNELLAKYMSQWKYFIYKYYYLSRVHLGFYYGDFVIYPKKWALCHPGKVPVSLGENRKFYPYGTGRLKTEWHRWILPVW